MNILEIRTPTRLYDKEKEKMRYIDRHRERHRRVRSIEEKRAIN